MRALFLRFYRFTGVRGLVVILAGGTIGLLLIVMGGMSALGGAGSIFGMAIGAIAMTIVAATRYRWPWRTPGHAEVLFPLVRSEREYCLVLRPFGRDGEIVVPKAMPNGDVGRGAGARNVTLEQIVAGAARSTLGLETYAIVDQDVLLAPPGPNFVRVCDEEWKTVALRLIRRAHSIVLILPPNQDIGDGFCWEIEQIVNSGAQSRVIIVLPPCDQDASAHQATLRHTCVLLALLEGSGRLAELDHFRTYEYELQLGANTLVLKYTERAGVRWWGVVQEETPQRAATLGVGRRTVVADTTYLSGLAEALRETEHELSGLGFEARYPLR